MNKLKIFILITFFYISLSDKASSLEIVRDVELENFTKKIVTSLVKDNEIDTSEINYYFIKSKENLNLETASEFNDLFCVGFAAESKNIIKNAQAKLKNKKLKMIVANCINESMGQNSAEIYMIDKNEVIHVPKKTKEELALTILKHIHKLENKRGITHEHIN